jgi:lysine-specific demethylase 8
MTTSAVQKSPEATMPSWAFASVEPVERVAGLLPRDFDKNFAKPHRPVILEGVASEWPAFSKWTLDFFETSFPGRRVPIEVWDAAEDERDAGSFLTKTQRVEMDWSAYVELCRASPPSKRHYLAQYPIFDAHPELRADVGSLEPYFAFPAIYPRPVRRVLTAKPLLWLGPGGTVTTLHFDMYQNMFVQLAGRKRFILVSPEQSDLVYYADPRFGMFASFSPVDIEQPDLDRYPLVRRVRALECVVEPGEMLFIPLGWWHHVRSFEPSTSMNFWWWPVVRTLVAGRRHILQSLRTKLFGHSDVRL